MQARAKHELKADVNQQNKKISKQSAFDSQIYNPCSVAFSHSASMQHEARSPASINWQAQFSIPKVQTVQWHFVAVHRVQWCFHQARSAEFSHAHRQRIV